MQRSTLIISILAICALSCGETVQDPINAPGTDDLVLENSLAVVAAAQAFAVANGGTYPARLSDTTPLGKKLVDFLPDGVLLTNPVTGLPTEPVFMEATGPGSTAYRSYLQYDEQWNPRWSGYYVVGDGELVDTVLTNVPDSLIALEQSVIDNCVAVRDAVEAFALDNNGEYPAHSNDLNLAGKRPKDYLPEGHLMENPYTRVNTEPQWGAAAAQYGETGYVPVSSASGVGGYLIEGMGSYTAPLLVTFYKDPPTSW